MWFFPIRRCLITADIDGTRLPQACWDPACSGAIKPSVGPRSVIADTGRCGSFRLSSAPITANTDRTRFPPAWRDLVYTVRYISGPSLSRISVCQDGYGRCGSFQLGSAPSQLILIGPGSPRPGETLSKRVQYILDWRSSFFRSN